MKESANARMKKALEDIMEFSNFPNSSALMDLIRKRAAEGLGQEHYKADQDRVKVIEFKGKRWAVVGESETEFLVTEPWEEDFGEATRVPKIDVIII